MPRQRLIGLEVGRFVAALLVACFHFSLAFHDIRHVYIFDMTFRPGHSGVEYFFVLSGFIIYYIHSKDIGQPARLRDFALKRFFRIYPMYWLVFAAMLAVFVAHPAFHDKRALAPFTLLLDGLLAPLKADPVLLQSWSLRHEIVFYALFGIAILNARIGIPVLILWQIACWIIGVMYPDDVSLWIKPFFFLYNVGFGFGIAAAWASDRWHPKRPGWIAFIGLAGFLGSMIVEWHIGRYWPVATRPLGRVASPLLYLSFATLVIFGLTQMEKRNPFAGEPVLKIFGGCSYLLYLIHAPLGSFLIRAFNFSVLKRIPNEIVFVLMIAITILISIVAHIFVEKPMLKFIRSRFITRDRGPQTFGAERPAPVTTASL